MQVWDGTDELQSFKASRFKLILNDDLVAIFRSLAERALAANVEPTAWMQHSSNHALKSETAHQRLELLQFQSQIKSVQQPSISSIALKDSEDGLVHDPDVHTVFPPRFSKYWSDGPLSGKTSPKWSKFHVISFGNANSLLRHAGACGGVYQIWFSRRMPGGKLIMRTELYVGSAAGEPPMPFYSCTQHT